MGSEKKVKGSKQIKGSKKQKDKNKICQWLFQGEIEAVERAVDLARTLLSGAQGPGPRAGDPVGPLGPRGPTLNLTLLTPTTHITLYSCPLSGAAVDRAAVDHAVDLARTLLSGDQGPGPRAGDPIGP